MIAIGNPSLAVLPQSFIPVFGDDATAEIVVLDRIPLTTGGKKQRFVSLPGGTTECGGVGAA